MGGEETWNHDVLEGPYVINWKYWSGSACADLGKK